VTLSDEEAKRRKGPKTVIERMAPPTFNVAVEIIDRTTWRVHLDLAAAVDAALKGPRPARPIHPSLLASRRSSLLMENHSQIGFHETRCLSKTQTVSP
jgi:hypothetical protein